MYVMQFTAILLFDLTLETLLAIRSYSFKIELLRLIMLYGKNCQIAPDNGRCKWCLLHLHVTTGDIAQEGLAPSY